MVSCKRLPRCEVTDVASIERDGLLPSMKLAASVQSGLVTLAFPGWSAYVVTDPDCISRIFGKDAELYDKPSADAWRELMGRGLIMAQGEPWKRARVRAQAVMGRADAEGLGPLIIQGTEQRISQWRAGQSIDCVEEMRHLALGLAVESMFGVPVTWSADEMASALKVVMTYSYGRMSEGRGAAAAGSERDELSHAIRVLRTIAAQVVDARRQRAPGSGARNDLLGALLRSEHGKDEAEHYAELCDEVITFLIAGSESTAVSLACTLWLLSGEPTVQHKLADEARRGVNEGGSPLANLSYARAVYSEALRLFPPAWSVARVASKAVELGGYEFPAGAVFFCCAYTVQRDSRWYPEPETFRPERWLDGGATKLPRFAYFPFGGGKRTCIGQHQALVEATLVLSCIVQTWALERASPELRMYGGVNLHPLEPVRVRLAPRA